MRRNKDENEKLKNYIERNPKKKAEKQSDPNLQLNYQISVPSSNIIVIVQRIHNVKVLWDENGRTSKRLAVRELRARILFSALGQKLRGANPSSQNIIHAIEWNRAE